MTGISAVGVHDDLTACDSAVPVRSSDDETACGINKKFGILVYHILRQDRIKDIFSDIFVDLLLAYILVMLSGEDHGIQTDRTAVFIIFYRHLSLAVRPKIIQGPVLADLCQLQCQLVGQSDWIRHVLLRLIAGVSEHHALISCADSFDLLVAHLVFLGFQSLVHSHGNVRGLLVNGCDHAAGVTVKAIFRPVISDLLHGFADDLLDVHISLGGDLSHNHNQTCGHCRLAGHTAHGILL